MTLCPAQTAPWRTTLLLALTDTAVIIGVTLAATLLRDIAGHGIQWSFYPRLLPFLLLLPLFNAVLGLYASITLPCRCAATGCAGGLPASRGGACPP